MTGDGAPKNCVACGSAPRQDFTLKNGERLLRCPTCGLAWWNWPAFDPAAFYDRDYFQSDQVDKGYNDYASMEREIRRTAIGRLRRIDKIRARLALGDRSPTGLSSIRVRSSSDPSAQPAREEHRPPAGAPDIRTDRRPMPPMDRGELLDLGCGTGIFLDEARRAGWRVAGFEVSEYGVAQAQARGLDVAAMPIEGLSLPSQRFDCVTLWDVIEHVRDPVATIASAVAALKRGGMLAVSTGDITSLCARLSGAKWHLFNLPEHLFFFSPDSLKRIIESHGCKVVGRVSEVNWIPVSYAVERLEKSLRMRVPLGRWLAARKWMLPATLFDVMGIYAIRE